MQSRNQVNKTIAMQTYRVLPVASAVPVVPVIPSEGIDSTALVDTSTLSGGLGAPVPPPKLASSASTAPITSAPGLFVAGSELPRMLEPKDFGDSIETIVYPTPPHSSRVQAPPHSSRVQAPPLEHHPHAVTPECTVVPVAVPPVLQKWTPLTRPHTPYRTAEPSDDEGESLLDAFLDFLLCRRFRVNS